MSFKWKHQEAKYEENYERGKFDDIDYQIGDKVLLTEGRKGTVEWIGKNAKGKEKGLLFGVKLRLVLLVC